ncbi:DUF2486 family protein [Paraburkholderia susongensis]|uniref:DUF2486 domain-containing protein n=1 Tax=Paraburkholderia susongensis TaxID=1515439 RepID=A0A1X7KVR2_9BURK|nr:DUF2486 family protein [Paraburkholderia susongensis]SMG45548.1 Protein of unknown function [Paraburkholderia susongensis]
MSDPNDNSIPVLNEVLVQGHAPQTRKAPGEAAAPAAQPASEPATPREPVFRTEPAFVPPPAPQAEPTLAPEPEPEPVPTPVPTPEQPASAAPVPAPEALHAHEPTAAAEPPAASPAAHPGEPVSTAQVELHQPHVADHTHAKKRVRPHHGVHVRHAHDGAHDEMEVSPGVFGRIEPPPPLEAGTIVPPDIGYEAGHEAGHDAAHQAAPAEPQLDTEVIAERLRGRFAGFLSGEGRGIIEARCRDALQQHTSLLVSQITREVAQTLEAEMTSWVREAVEEELGRRSGRA